MKIKIGIDCKGKRIKKLCTTKNIVHLADFTKFVV